MIGRTLRHSMLVLAVAVSAPFVQAAPTTQTNTISPATTTISERSYRQLPWEKDAVAWGLTPEDMTRYRKIMSGPAGLWYHGKVSPVWVLGMYAESDTQRDRYAELALRLERQRVGRELAFQRAYDRAGRRLFPNDTVISPKLAAERNQLAALARAVQSPPLQSAVAPGPADRYQLVTTAKPCSACDALLTRLLGKVKQQNRRLDIHVSDARTDNDIRQWAAKHNIPVDRVRSGQITLNHATASVNALSTEIPALFFLRDGRYFPLTTP